MSRGTIGAARLVSTSAIGSPVAFSTSTTHPSSADMSLLAKQPHDCTELKSVSHFYRYRRHYCTLHLAAAVLFNWPLQRQRNGSAPSDQGSRPAPQISLKMKLSCRDDTVPKTVDTRSHCKVWLRACNNLPQPQKTEM